MSQCLSSSRYAIYYTLVGFTILLAGYLQVCLWTLAAGRQIKRIRTLFFHCIMRQEISWFDVTETGELNTRLSECVTEHSHTHHHISLMFVIDTIKSAFLVQYRPLYMWLSI